MSVTTKTLWNVKTAHIGGSWHIDSLHGLLDGVLYINREAFEHREPKELTLRGSRGSVVTSDSLEGAAVGSVSMTLLDDVSTSSLVAYQVSSGSPSDELEGIYQIDALYTESDNEGGSVDAYTKAEVDAKVDTLNTAVNRKANSADVYNKGQVDTSLGGKVDTKSVSKVSKATANSSNTVSKVASDATLAQLITAFNLSVDTLNTVRSTAGSAYNAVNGVIDGMTAANIMKE